MGIRIVFKGNLTTIRMTKLLRILRRVILIFGIRMRYNILFQAKNWKVLTVPKAVNETRLRPDVDVLYKQAVGTEDVYGGWSGINPSSTSC